MALFKSKEEKEREKEVALAKKQELAKKEYERRELAAKAAEEQAALEKIREAEEEAAQAEAERIKLVIQQMPILTSGISNDYEIIGAVKAYGHTLTDSMGWFGQKNLKLQDLSKSALEPERIAEQVAREQAYEMGADMIVAAQYTNDTTVITVDIGLKAAEKGIVGAVLHNGNVRNKFFREAVVRGVAVKLKG